MLQKNTRLVAALVVAAFITRIVQVFTVIDYKTGFYKNEYALLGTLLTAAVLALCFAAAFVARKALIIEAGQTVKIMPFISALTAVALGCEFVFEKFTIQGVAWQVMLMKVFGLLATVYFLAVAITGFLKIRLPDLVHIIPACYMIIRIVCSFVNISSLSLIAENVFLIASFCCTLLFFVGYASLHCLDDNDYKSINFRSVLAFALCYVTAASNIFAYGFVPGGYRHIPLYTQFVMIALALYIGVFAFSSLFKKDSE